MKYLTRIWYYLRPYLTLAIVSVIVTLFAVGVSLLEPWPLKFLIDSVLSNHPLPPFLATFLGPMANDRFSMLLFAVFAGLGLVLLQNGLALLNKYLQTTIGQNMALNFRSDLFQHVQRLSMSYHDRRRSGALIYAVNFQGDAAPHIVMSVLPLFQSFLTLIGMFWISFTINRQMALLSLVVVPVLYYAVGYYAKRIQVRLREVRNMEAHTLSIVHESMSMLRVIVAFCRENYEHGRFRSYGETALVARVNLTIRQTLFSLGVNLTTAIGTAIVLGFGAYNVLQRRLTIGELLVMMSYIMAVYKPLETISTSIVLLQENLVSLQLAFDVLDKDPEIKDAPDAVAIEGAKGHVTFEDVQFTYTRRSNTLKNISFEVQPGQAVALVGPTGAGKTTLISLIPRFYAPSEGRILLDGTDISTITLASLRKQISIVQQEPLLFAGTIADNIRYGQLEASMEQIIEVAKAANAHDFITRLPKQYDTEVGERGVQLSGGERQRICIARAFLKDAPILILDEPTSAVDSKTEANILEALERLMIGRTTFIVAHRLSTIRNADFIIVLNHGEIVEQGTHEELLDNDGLYKQLYDAQSLKQQRKARAILELVTPT